MIAFGSNDAIQGLTAAKDALQGQSSQGWNPLKDRMQTWSPSWGVPAYDALSLATTLGGAFGKVPLVVDPAVTGINTTRSIFGAAVPRMNNSIRIPGTDTVLDSNATRAILGASAAGKAGQLADDIRKRN